MKSFLLYLFSMSFLINAQDGKNIKHELRELNWLTGKWVGKEWGGHIEEYWSEPLGKTMIGAFKLVVNDSTKIIEFLIIQETPEDIILRFKHFDNNLISWENAEALTFNLKELKERKAVFESSVQTRPKTMTYHEVVPDSLVVTVESEVEGNVTSFQTHKKRVK